MAQCYVIDHRGHGHVLDFTPGETLARVVYLSGRFSPPAMCSGLGRCGQCRMRFESRAPEPCDADLLTFSPEEIEEGWRLGCRHEARDTCAVTLPEPKAAPKAARVVAADRGTAVDLAVDLGTTSLWWELVADGETVRAGSEVNPQMGAGSEVMSRLAYAQQAEGGGATLRELVLRRLRGLAEAAGGVRSCCIAGNTAMLSILLDKPLEGLARAPYQLEYQGGETLDLPGLPGTYIPPLFGPFIGADLSAGLTWVCTGRGEEPDYPFVLADLGTNGEFILAAAPDAFMVASVPMGPALEGIGLTFGTMAGPGAASRFSVTPSGVAAEVIGGGEPAGITGTGYLSLAQALYHAGFLDFEGRFAIDAPVNPLAARLAGMVYEERGERRFPLPGGMYLTARDVEEILKVKAAFNLAFSKLLDTVGFAPSDLASVWLAGAMGTHVSPADLEGLGFLPEGMGRLLRVAGNSSLEGAKLFLHSPEARSWAEMAAFGIQVLDLAGEAEFGDEYIARMGFVYVP